MSKVGDQESPKWVAYNHRDELVRAMNETKTLQQHLDEIMPIVEAACAFVDLQQAAHHGPIKNETKIRVRAELYNAVMTYQEGQQ